MKIKACNLNILAGISKVEIPGIFCELSGFILNLSGADTTYAEHVT
jgi:hypothetical protein